MLGCLKARSLRHPSQKPTYKPKRIDQKCKLFKPRRALSKCFYAHSRIFKEFRSSIEREDDLYGTLFYGELEAKRFRSALAMLKSSQPQTTPQSHYRTQIFIRDLLITSIRQDKTLEESDKVLEELCNLGMLNKAERLMLSIAALLSCISTVPSGMQILDNVFLMALGEVPTRHLLVNIVLLSEKYELVEDMISRLPSSFDLNQRADMIKVIESVEKMRNSVLRDDTGAPTSLLLLLNETRHK